MTEAIGKMDLDKRRQLRQEYLLNRIEKLMKMSSHFEASTFIATKNGFF